MIALSRKIYSRPSSPGMEETKELSNPVGLEKEGLNSDPHNS